MKLPINESHWRNMNEYEIGIFKKEIFDYYKNKGFPYYDLTVEEQVNEISKMNDYFKKNSIIENDIIKQTMHCLGTAWTYFPHSWNIVCGNHKTPMQVFNDDLLFMKSIERRLKRGSYISDGGIRKALKSYTSVQSVSNFRPSASKAIYEKYGGKVVYDPCMGFGGRFIGALSSNNVKKYIGCDPSIKTFEGLDKMGSNLANMKNEFEYEMNMCGSEDYIPNEEVDMVFTSPPYFDTEKYSEDETQSYKKFPTYEKWIDGFLKTMIKNSIFKLKKDGYIIINIANVKTAQNVENDFNKIMLDFGLKYIKTYKMLLSNISKGGYKYEPVFVYKK